MSIRSKKRTMGCPKSRKSLLEGSPLLLELVKEYHPTFGLAERRFVNLGNLLHVKLHMIFFLFIIIESFL